jgi:hypothetical protein
MLRRWEAVIFDLDGEGHAAGLPLLPDALDALALAAATAPTPGEVTPALVESVLS